MSKLAKLLSLPDMADRLAEAGRGKDSILAHINPTEARLLKARGGSGKRNPRTGIVEFDEIGEGDAYQYKPEDYSNAPAFAQPEPPVAPATDESQAETNRYAAAPAPLPPASPFSANQVSQVETQPTGGQPTQGAYLPLSPAAAPVPSGAAPARPANEAVYDAIKPKPGFMDTLKGYSNQLKTLNEVLQPAAPYLKAGAGLYGAYQGQQATQQAQAQAAKNEAQIKALADPYRKQAEQYKTQGQQLIDLGQGGGLTSAQQKQLEIQRAQASQQMASSGVTGGTSQQQLEANLQQQAATFAQQNVDQGMKLVAAAMGINQTADKYIQDAITTGYTQNKDAQALSADFYKSIAQFLEPDVNTNPTSKAPGQAKVGAIE